ncbi:hsp70-Hsp90 organizing protein 1-like [Acanthaster planci]|uniref:Hsp70-Hsp90 organizing protein 1-like n=1 Tax=Acanthaster planci TaxID=133434 RepID=A0A8B7YUJ1_ACAPL|nr:hsp70-Hsp90 organizing protein 1-like [Acanthaster planci]
MNKEKADEARERGNDCMKQGRATQAFFYYTEAIKLNPSDHRSYSNRSLAFLKIEQHYHALEDAKKAIQLKPNWPKGYFRKGEVEFRTGHYQDAVNSYEKAISLDESDLKLKSALEKAQEEVKKMKAAAIRIPFISIGIGFLIGILLTLADHYLTSKPSLEGYVKLAFVALFGMLGYCGSWMYFYVLTTYHDAMLQPPPEQNDADKKTDKSTDPETSKGKRTKPSQESAKKDKATGEARRRKKTEKT